LEVHVADGDAGSQRSGGVGRVGVERVGIRHVGSMTPAADERHARRGDTAWVRGS